MNVGDPVVVLSGLGMVHTVLEDNDVIIGDLVLGRACGGDQRRGALIDNSGVVDGGSDSDRDGSEEREERGSQSDLHAGRWRESVCMCIG